MLRKIFNFLIKRKTASAIIIVLLAAGGYFLYTTLTKSAGEIRYVLASVQKGTIIVSVSGSGQVSASNQVDIKSKVAGDVVYVGIKKDQGLKAGTLLVQIDARDTQRAVSDAEITLASAKIDLEELLAGSDAQSLLQAQNALAQAERDLEKAEKTYENIGTDAESTLVSAYEDGYSNVSTSFFNLSGYMKDLQDVMGTEKSELEHVDSYAIILGADSPFIQKLLDDYYQAKDLYNKNFKFFGEVFRDDDRDTVYRLINDTLETTKAISQAFESARHMYDAISAASYTQYFISSTIDKMQPKIESGLPSVFSIITSLQKTIDTIDSTIQDTPDKIKDAPLALESAKEKLAGKKLELKDILTGADPLDIRTQQNTVAQKEAALTTAKEKLADCFVRAPFDGIAAEVNVKKGDSISSNTAIATFITNQHIAEITLNEIDAAKIKIGQKVTFTIDAVEGLTLTGEVIEVDTLGTVAQGVVNYSVKISFDTQDDRVKPGMSVSAAIITEAKQNVLLVPNSAVKTQGDTNYVETLENISASNMLSASALNNSGLASATPPQQKNVEIGISNDTSTEIISGLKEGDQVVTQTISANTTQTQSQNNTGVRIPGIGGFGR